jgi:hypothetical protein
MTVQTLYPSTAGVVVVLGDSHTGINPSAGWTCGAEASWCAQLGYALAGLAANLPGAAPAYTVLSVSGSTLTLDRDAGPAFQPGTVFQLEAPGVTIWQATQPDVLGPLYAVTMQSGDTITVTPAPPPGLPSGTQIVGRGGGKALLAKNCGHPGYTTAQMLGLIQTCFFLGDQPIMPKLAIFGHCTNDWNPPGSSTVQATGSNDGTLDTFAVEATKGASIATPGSWLTIGGVTGWLVTAVSTDTITAKPPAGTAAANVAAGTSVKIDTQNTLTAIGQYFLNKGVPAIAIVGQKFDNLASGGDWVGGAPVKAAWKVTATTYQQNAAAALAAQYGITVPYLDIWQAMADRIAAGRDAGGSACYEITASNTHPGAYGGMVMGMTAMRLLAASGVLAGL